ncbi:MAG: phage tail tape measure protein [bacterium]
MEATHNLGIDTSIDINKALKSLERLERNFKDFEGEIKKVNKEAQKLNKTFDKIGKENKDYSKEIDKSTKRLKQQENQIKKLDKTTDRLNKTKNNNTDATKKNKAATDNWLSSKSQSMKLALESITIWGLATSAVYGSIQAMREINEVIKEVNTRMVDLQKVMNPATTDFDELRDVSGKLGIDFARNMVDVLEIMTEWGRQGRDQLEVIELTKSALLASNATLIEAGDSVKYLTSALLQFNIPVSEATRIVDKLNEVSNKTPANALDLAESIKEAGAAASSAGVSIDQLIGLTSALVGATAKSGNRIGNALKTIFSRIRVGGADGSEAVSKVEQELNKVGIALRKSETEFRDTFQVLSDLSNKWDDLNDVQKENLAYAISGRRRYSDLKALISNFDKAIEGTEYSMDSLNSAQDENQRYLESLEGYINRSKTAFQELSTTISKRGGLEGLKNFYDILKNTYEIADDVVVGIADIKDAMSELLDPDFWKVAGGTAGTAATLWGFATHPVLTSIATLTGLILALAQQYGDLSKKMSEAKDTANNLNKAINNNNEVNELQYKNIQDVINEQMNLIETTRELGKESEKTTGLIHNLDEVPGIGGWLQDIVPDFLTGDYKENIKSLRELAKGLFPDISDIKDNNEFLNALEESLNRLSDSFSVIEKESNNGEEVLKSISGTISNYQQEINDLADNFEDISDKLPDSIDFKKELPQDILMEMEVASLGLPTQEGLKKEIQILNKYENEWRNFLVDLKNISKNVLSKEELIEEIKIETNFDKLTKNQQEIVMDSIDNMKNLNLKKQITNLTNWITDNYLIGLRKQMDIRTADIELIDLNKLFLESLGRDLTKKELENALSTIETFLNDKSKIKTQKQLDKFKEYFEEFNEELKTITKEEDYKVIYDTISSIFDVSEFDNPILDGSAKENTDKLIKSLSNIQNKFVDINLSSFDVENIDNLKDYIESMQELKSALNYLEDSMPGFKNKIQDIFNKEEIQKLLKISIEKFEELNRTKLINEKELDLMDDLDEKIKSLEEEIDLFTNMKEEATNSENVKRLNNIILQLKDNLEELNTQKIDNEILKTLNEDGLQKRLENIKDTISDFNLSDIIGTKETVNQIKIYKDLLNVVYDTMNKIKASGLSQEKMKELLDPLKVNKKEIKKILDELFNFKDEIYTNTKEAVLQGLIDGFNNFEPDMGFAEKLATLLRGALSGIFDNEHTKKDFTNWLNEGLGLSDKWTTGITAGLESISKGNSGIGGVLTGIGAAFSSSPWGMALGAIGQIGGSLWGGDTGRSPSDLSGLKSTVKDAKNFLKQYNVEDLIPNLRWKDQAGWWQKLWGGSDIKIFNEEQIKEAIERIKGIVEDSANGINNALQNAFTANTEDFKLAIEQSLGKVLQDALIDSIMEQQFVKNVIGNMSRVIAEITKDGRLTDKEINRYENALSNAKDQLQDARNMIDELSEISGFDVEQDTTIDNSFTAGSTTNITYHQQYVVQSQLFTGSEEEAEEAARLLMPYIREELAREAGR